jgi:hypothetical protein
VNISSLVDDEEELKVSLAKELRDAAWKKNFFKVYQAQYLEPILPNFSLFGLSVCNVRKMYFFHKMVKLSSK